MKRVGAGLLTGAVLLAFVSPLTCSAESENEADPDAGRAVLLDRDRGHCLLCHQVRQLDAPFQGNIGPDLSNVGDRLNAKALRERIMDPTRFNPDTAMPAYHKTEGLRQVMREHVGEPVLSAQELDDLVAYLQTLTHMGE